MTSLKRNARQIQFTGDPTDITGRLGKKKDVFYRFRLARSSDISLTLDGFAAKANVDLFLLNRKNRVLRKSTKPGNAAESISTALKPGEYLIRVQNKRSKTKTSFQLQIATTTPLAAPTPSPSTTPSPTGEAKSLTVQRGQTLPLKFSPLAGANRSGSEQRYVITQSPRNGFLQLDGKPLAVGQSFNQADLDQGRVTYRSARAGVTVIGNGTKPLVSGSNMVWQGPGGSDGGADNEIFFSDGITTKQLTQNAVDDKVLGISGNRVVWASQVGAADSKGATYELFESNGTTTNRLTNNAVNEEFVGVDGEHLFWISPIGPLNQYGYPTHEVFYAKNGAVRQLTNNRVDETVSDFEAGTAVWEAALGPVNAGRATSEVFYFNGNDVQQITNNNVDDLAPRLDNGRIAWSSRVGVSEVGAPSTEVMLFDGTSTQRITFNNTDDFVSDIKGNQLVWLSRSGPFNGMGLRTFELFRFDGATTQRLTTNATDESLVDISGSNLLWMGVALPTPLAGGQLNCSCLMAAKRCKSPATKWTMCQSVCLVLRSFGVAELARAAHKALRLANSSTLMALAPSRLPAMPAMMTPPVSQKPQLPGRLATEQPRRLSAMTWAMSLASKQPIAATKPGRIRSSKSTLSRESY
ncbi:MAG: hypothetical protein EDM05_63855 [Leptolyngbya sp. IPPAS B-1204]